MDAVRFGRALGFGARQAVKTVASAVDAATAESPTASPATSRSAGPGAGTVAGAGGARTPAAEGARAAGSPQSSSSSSIPSAAVNKAAKAAAQGAASGVVQGAAHARGMRRGLSRFRASALEPVVRLSGVLWLEVMGVFFGIFAVFAATWVWRLRGEWRAGVAHPGAHGAFVGGVAMLALFGYFCVSSFVRAKRRERRRG